MLLLVYDYIRNGNLRDHVGTWGYINYECYTSTNFTCESDMYAFGVLVLEVVYGRPQLHKGASGFHMLVDWLSNLHGEGRLLEVVDQRLGGECVEQDAEWLPRLGLVSNHPNRSLCPTT
ncbi:L-type lectin-domain containing receptor kinase S.1-like [Musa acuminata AAA Group]|uniref:L-type lectin-domain containing receptor kinase S.1-like n=1 Tax=Musa acuminata AAA Group TaxID=214697 RepID=UPI0031DA2E1C